MHGLGFGGGGLGGVAGVRRGGGEGRLVGGGAGGGELRSVDGEGRPARGRPTPRQAAEAVEDPRVQLGDELVAAGGERLAETLPRGDGRSGGEVALDGGRGDLHPRVEGASVGPAPDGESLCGEDATVDDGVAVPREGDVRGQKPEKDVFQRGGDCGKIRAVLMHHSKTPFLVGLGGVVIAQ